MEHFLFFLEPLVVGRQTFDKKELDLGGGFKKYLKNYLHPKLGEDSPKTWGRFSHFDEYYNTCIWSNYSDLTRPQTPNGGEK